MKSQRMNEAIAALLEVYAAEYPTGAGLVVACVSVDADEPGLKTQTNVEIEVRASNRMLWVADGKQIPVGVGVAEQVAAALIMKAEELRKSGTREIANA